jgi:hypothetical protein
MRIIYLYLLRSISILYANVNDFLREKQTQKRPFGFAQDELSESRLTEIVGRPELL